MLNTIGGEGGKTHCHIHVSMLQILYAVINVLSAINNISFASYTYIYPISVYIVNIDIDTKYYY